MWWTPDGERILQGAEAGLFREALGMVVDMVREDNESLLQLGAPPFDNLQPNQKLAVLAQVGSALLRENEPMPNRYGLFHSIIDMLGEAESGPAGKQLLAGFLGCMELNLSI
jgi:hypothetical protein